MICSACENFTALEIMHLKSLYTERQKHKPKTGIPPILREIHLWLSPAFQCHSNQRHRL